MKTSLIILFVLGIVLVGCNSKHLDKQTSLAVIKKSTAYPLVLDKDIYCSDPEYTRKLLAAGLERDGWITVLKTQKLGDAGKPMIQFTEKAQPYLLVTSAKDKVLGIQKVKLAEEDITEIISIQDDESTKTKLVEYTTAYKNISPFAALINRDFNKLKTHKVHLALHDGNWQIEGRMDD